MQKLWIAPLLLASFAGGPVYAQIPDQTVRQLEGQGIQADREHNLDYFVRFTHTYFETDIGMTAEDYARYQMAEGLLKESKLEKAARLIDELQKAYEQSISVKLLMARLQLALHRPEQALDVLDATGKLLEPLEDEDQPILLQVVLLRIAAYQDMHQPAKSLSVLQNAPIKTHLLNSADQEAYFLTLADLLMQSGQPDEAYHYLMAILDSGKRSDQTNAFLAKWQPSLAEGIYHQALTAYQQRNYIRTQRLALISYHLDPEPVKYSTLLANAQEQVIEMVNDHFDRAVPQLTEAIRQLRYDIQSGDEQAAYKHYQALRNIPDVAFFLNQDFEGYLPVSMQVVLRDVEESLRAHGFKI